MRVGSSAWFGLSSSWGVSISDESDGENGYEESWVEITANHREPLGAGFLFSERENDRGADACENGDGVEENRTDRRNASGTHLNRETPAADCSEQNKVRDVVEPPSAAAEKPDAKDNVPDGQNAVSEGGRDYSDEGVHFLPNVKDEPHGQPA